MLRPAIALITIFMIVTFAVIQIGTLMRYSELAYTASDGTNTRLYLLDVDHGLGYRLANAPLAEPRFAWSPDGMWLAFTSVAGAKTEIFIAGANGRSLRQLTVNTEWEFSPAWSPDSQYLVFIREATNRVDFANIVIMNVATRAERIIADISENPTTLAWSPNSRSIAYIENSSPSDHIKVIDAQTGELQAQVNELTGSLGDLSWSPDSTHLLFTVVDSRVSIYVMEIASNRITQLTDAAQHNETPVWSPDGTQIIFVSTRDGNRELYIMNVDGTNQQRISYGQDTIESFPAWSLDGRRIAYAEYLYTDIYVMNIDDNNLQRFPVNSALGQMVIRWRP